MTTYDATAKFNAGFRRWRQERLSQLAPHEERRDCTMRETLLGIGVLTLMGALFFAAAMWIYGG